MNQIRKDLLLITSLFFAVIAIWIIFFSFDFNSIVGRNDATSGFVWLLNEYSRKSLQELAYNPSVLGGYPMSGALGLMWPLYGLMKLTGLEPYITQDLFVFFIQASIGYFSFKYIEIFSSESYREEVSLQKKLDVFFILCLSAFSPLLGWRIGYGHFNLLLGVLTLIALIYIFHSAIEKKFSVMDGVISFFGLSIAINFPAFQVFAHIIYLIPFYFWFVGKPSGAFKNLWDKKILIWLFVFVIVNSYYAFDLYSYYLFGDSSRASEIDIYSYGPMTWPSLFMSLVWHNNYISLSPNPFLWHELHYPIGLGFLSLFFLKDNKRRAITSVVLLFLLLGLIMNLPILGSIFKSLPLIKSMRVPQRVLIPVSFLMTISSAIWILRKVPRFQIEKKHLASLAIVSLAFIVLIQNIDSYFEVILVISLIGMWKAATFKEYPELALGFLLGIGFLSIGSFYAKNHPLLNFSDIQKDMNRFRPKEIDTNPYERNFVMTQHSEFGLNTALALHVPSLNAYFYSTGRFSRLIHAINEVPYNPLELQWKFSDNSPHAFLTSQLFNIRNTVSIAANRLVSTPVEMKHSGIIFPSSIIFNDSVEMVASTLREDWRIAVVEEMYRSNLQNISGCEENSLKTNFNRDTRALEISGSVKETCLVVIPTNFSKKLELNLNGLPATDRLIPVNHALLGVVVPAGQITSELKGKFSF